MSGTLPKLCLVGRPTSFLPPRCFLVLGWFPDKLGTLDVLQNSEFLVKLKNISKKIYISYFW
jgi:hypothetical protein